MSSTADFEKYFDDLKHDFLGNPTKLSKTQEMLFANLTVRYIEFKGNMSHFDYGAREGKENDTEKYDTFDYENVAVISEDVQNNTLKLRLKYILNDCFY